MKKRMMVMLIGLGILFGLIILYKLFVSYMTKQYMAKFSNQVAYVSTMKAAYSNWQSKITAIGSTRAVQGVNVTTELAGLVTHIYFKPGSSVKKGDILVQLNSSTELNQLRALQASQALAQIVYNRDQAQFAIQAISKAQLDNDRGNLKNLEAQVAQQQATLTKKTIVAPFSGQLGISAINPGQYLNAGDKVVTLQTLNPIYVDFYVPQQQIMKLNVGQSVKVTADSYNQAFSGAITTIDPVVDVNTRNVEVEATVDNPNNKLIPGMYVAVRVDTGQAQHLLTLPQTAISYNPYGELIYIIQKEKENNKEGKAVLIAKQVFVVTGETRGDQVAILKGIKSGDEVVTSGQLKLKNGSKVAINNSILPVNNAHPNLANEHEG